jgi:hypothetical protein
VRLVGNEIQKNDQPVAGQQIIVRVKNGVLVAVTQPTDPDLKIGQGLHQGQWRRRARDRAIAFIDGQAA